MGAGKSTIGQRLAARLRLPFVDCDREIERAANLSIPEIFERFGESYFRDGERRVIARLMGEAPAVIATGGGAFMNERTRSLILGSGYAIWLDADIDMLVERTARRPGQRPLLVNGDPHAVLASLAAARNPTYALAHLHIRNQTTRHDTAVEMIVKALEEGQMGIR